MGTPYHLCSKPKCLKLKSLLLTKINIHMTKERKRLLELSLYFFWDLNLIFKLNQNFRISKFSIESDSSGPACHCYLHSYGIALFLLNVYSIQKTELVLHTKMSVDEKAKVLVYVHGEVNRERNKSNHRVSFTRNFPKNQVFWKIML